ncbi:DUF6350 family protein [Streptomyces sp. NPDC002018]|uniref:cell division protein PerM n=1 Tax=Streptomyces sp. NPDC002018 TaxID=3364629 RepID=UPI00367AFD84
MTQLTDRSAPLSSASAVERGRAAALTVSFLRGAIAACLGLGVFAVLVLAMWIISPYPDSGAGGALRVAAALWLLAHGVELVRADTLSGNPAPLGVIPLLLMALPVWLVHRTARDALEPDDGPPRLSVSAVVATLTGGYLLVGAASVLSVMGAPLAVRPVRAALALPALVVLSALAGAWRAGARPRGPLPSWLPGALRSGLVRALGGPAARRGAAVALRAGAASVLLLLGGGALLVGISLAWHGEATHTSFAGLASDWSGRFAVLLLGTALVPNAAVWGAAYGLGPGFALGTAATATPFGVTGDRALPPFPLLAAVPDGPGSALTCGAVVVPVLAGGALTWFTVRVAAPPHGEKEEAWRPGATALTAAFGAVVCAVLTSLLAALSGGPMGTGRLAVLGPVWWLTGGAALVWALGLGVPMALLLRAWRLRERPCRTVPAQQSEPTVGTGAGPSDGAGTGTGAGGAGGSAGPEEPDGPAAPWWPAPWRRLMWLLSGRAVAEGSAHMPSSEAAGGLGVLVAGGKAAEGKAAEGKAAGGKAAGGKAESRGGRPVAGRAAAARGVRVARAAVEARRGRVGRRASDGRGVRVGAGGRREPRGRGFEEEPGFEPYDFLLDDTWHDRGTRQTRWAAIKAASVAPTADLRATGTASGPPSVRKGGPKGSVPDSGAAPGAGSGAAR